MYLLPGSKLPLLACPPLEAISWTFSLGTEISLSAKVSEDGQHSVPVEVGRRTSCEALALSNCLASLLGGGLDVLLGAVGEVAWVGVFGHD